MIGHDLKYVDSAVKEMTYFFETRYKNLEPKEDEKKSSTSLKKKTKGKRFNKKRKRDDSDPSILESR